MSKTFIVSNGAIAYLDWREKNVATHRVASEGKDVLCIELIIEELIRENRTN